MPAMRHISTFAIVLLFALSPLPTAAANTDDAIAFVQNLGDSVIEVLKSPETTPEQRHVKYQELLERGFALNTIARFVLGRYWRAATPEQQREYLGLFRLFVLEIYASRLDSYSGQSFTIVKAHPIGDKDTLVNTEVSQTDAEPLRVDYRVRARQGSYKIIDVIVEGISLVRAQREEFASIIKHEGFDGLLELMPNYDGAAPSN